MKSIYFILSIVFSAFSLAGEIKLDGQLMPSLEVAMSEAKDGSKISIGAGIYKDGGVLKANFVTIEGVKGTHLKGFSAKGKGTLVIQGNDNEIVNIECSNVNVRDGNGACVRFEGTNIQLRNVFFHDSQQGFLSGKNSGLILIENSRFERLGKSGRAHGIYVGSGELYINNSHFLSSKDEGHEIKSRAEKTIIQNTTIASLYGKDSRLIDISSGGILEVTDCILEQGNNTSNSDLIGFALEGTIYETNAIKIKNNVFLLDRERGNRLLHTRGKVESTIISNNTIIGKLSGNKFDESNTFYKTRKEAGLKSFPALSEEFHD